MSKERRLLFELVHRLVRSTDVKHQRRLKDELARLIFGA
jgi:hypothetical protein